MSRAGPAAAFYCVADERYFLGAVAMINSLRLQGHDQPIYLCDLALADQQRRLLAGEVTLVEAPPGTPPWLAKTIAPLAHPAEVMVLIDADMIATRPLGELIERVAEGGVLAFETDLDRHFPEWSELLDLGPIRRQPYLCSAFVALGQGPGAETLARLHDRQGLIDLERTFAGSDDPSYPLRYIDQDVFNAVVASSLEAGQLIGLAERLGPSLLFDEPELIDAGTLSCRYPDGTEPYLIHHLAAKPWLKPMYDGTYSRLLQRLLVGPDLAIRVPARTIPLRLRDGALARLERTRVDAAVRVRWSAGIRMDRYRHRFGLPPRHESPARR